MVLIDLASTILTRVTENKSSRINKALPRQAIEHVRHLCAQYEFTNYIAIEGRVYTSNDDNDIDINGDRFAFDTGNIIGVYAKPKTNFAKANVYGLVGLSMWDTTYTAVTGSWAPSRDKDSVVMFGVGVGGEFNITKNLRFNIEGMIHAGSVDSAADRG